MAVDIIVGDCRDVLGDLPDASFDCILTDPPYGETSLDWDVSPHGATITHKQQLLERECLRTRELRSELDAAEEPMDHLERELAHAQRGWTARLLGSRA